MESHTTPTPPGEAGTVAPGKTGRCTDYCHKHMGGRIIHHLHPGCYEIEEIRLFPEARP